METAMPPSGQSSSARLPWQRRLRDAMLLPFALLLVLGGIVVHGGARVLRRSKIVRHAEAVLGHLPAWAILPLFLIPEGMSHVGGFYAAFLLAHHQFLAATVTVVLIKGVGLMVALWIYQACRSTLMTVRWFAWCHGKLEAARHWALARIRPAWWRTRAFARTAEPGSPHSGRRLSAIRVRLRTQILRPRQRPNCDSP